MLARADARDLLHKMERGMKQILIVLTAVAFMASTVPAVWAQGGEPRPPTGEPKGGKPPVKMDPVTPKH
jgi:hypothetical protein